MPLKLLFWLTSNSNFDQKSNGEDLDLAVWFADQKDESGSALYDVTYAVWQDTEISPRKLTEGVTVHRLPVETS